MESLTNQLSSLRLDSFFGLQPEEQNPPIIPRALFYPFYKPIYIPYGEERLHVFYHRERNREWRIVPQDQVMIRFYDHVIRENERDLLAPFYQDPFSEHIPCRLRVDPHFDHRVTIDCTSCVPDSITHDIFLSNTLNTPINTLPKTVTYFCTIEKQNGQACALFVRDVFEEALKEALAVLPSPTHCSLHEKEGDDMSEQCVVRSRVRMSTIAFVWNALKLLGVSLQEKWVAYAVEQLTSHLKTRRESFQKDSAAHLFVVLLIDRIIWSVTIGWGEGLLFRNQKQGAELCLLSRNTSFNRKAIDTIFQRGGSVVRSNTGGKIFHLSGTPLTTPRAIGAMYTPGLSSRAKISWIARDPTVPVTFVFGTKRFWTLCGPEYIKESFLAHRLGSDIEQIDQVTRELSESCRANDDCGSFGLRIVRLKGPF